MRFAIPLTLVLLLAGGLLAGSGAAKSDAQPPGLIQLISVTTSQQNFDKPPKGPSKGDRSFGVSTLINAVPQFGRKAGAAVGTDRAWYTFKSKTHEFADGTTRLPGGTIRFRGKISTVGGLLTIPVVGGTGRFEGAVGTLYVGSATNGNRAENVYRLSYDLMA